MSTSTDILASVQISASAALTAASTGSAVGPCRVKALSIVPTGTAGTVVLRDGSATGPIIATINTVASATQPTYMLLPGNGLRFRTLPYAALSNIGFLTVFYA